VPLGDISTAGEEALFDDLVGADKQGRWYIEAKGLSGLKIDYQLKFRWCLYWQIGWLRTTENAINVCSCAAKQIQKVHAIEGESSFVDEVTKRVNRRKAITCSQLNDQSAIDNAPCLGSDHKASSRFDRKRIDTRLNIRRAIYTYCGCFDAKRTGRSLERTFRTCSHLLAIENS
jgi:hypothetical protein